MAESQKRIVVGFLLENAAEFKQDLGEIREAAEGFGDEGVKSAQELVDAFDRIELGAAKVAEKITAGRTVSDRDLAAMKQTYGQLEKQIEATFGSIEKAPVEIQKAFTKAESQIAGSVGALRLVQAQTEAATERFEELGRQALRTGDQIQTLPSDVAQAFKGANAAVAEFTTRFQESGDVGTGELEKIVKAQERLRIAIERSGKSLDELGPEAKQSFDIIDREAAAATQVVQRLEAAVDRNKIGVQSMATSWSSLGDAVAQSMGRHGDAAVQLGIVHAALNEIKSLIELTEKSVGAHEMGVATLSSTYADLKTRLTDAATAAQKAAADIAASGAVLATSAPSWANLRTFVDDYRVTFDRLGAALYSGKDGQIAFQAALDASLPSFERLILANRNGAEVAEFYRAAMAAGADGQRLWSEAVAKAGGTADGFMQQVERLTPILATLSSTTDAQRAAADRVTEGWEAYRKKLAQVEEEQEKAIRKITDATMKQLEQNMAIDGASEVMKQYFHQLAAIAPNVDRLSAAWDQNVKSAQDALDAAFGLTSAERARLQGLLDLAAKMKDLDEGQRSYVRSQLNAIMATEGSTASMVKWTDSAETGRTKISNFAKDVETTVNGYIKFSTAVQIAADSMEGFTTRADKAADVLKKLQDQTAATAGTGPGTAAATGGAS